MQKWEFSTAKQKWGAAGLLSPTPTPIDVSEKVEIYNMF